MAHLNKVCRSLETPDGVRCVDFFQRPDGSFGFELYRRDAEDPSGWFAVGCFGDMNYETLEKAWGNAKLAVPWVVDA